MDNMAWILDTIHKHDHQTGKRTLDYLTIHIYPQQTTERLIGPDAQALHRNENTRQFWDPNYVDGSWITDKMMVIPRLKAMVAKYYPGTKIGITEYSWGPERTMNGATAQADLLGIFGREGLDMATRWIVPTTDSLVYQTYQLYRNYDGKDSGFGDLSVSDSSDANTDNVSSFAAIRKSDGSLTVMIINKQLHQDQPVSVNINGLAYDLASIAQVYQLGEKGILRLPDINASGALNIESPASSVTLLVIPKK
jgi:alpha-L-arabinofuranosidase